MLHRLRRQLRIARAEQLCAALILAKRVSLSLGRSGGPAADEGDNASLMHEMQHAIAGDALMLAYQPQHDFRSGRIRGAECLVRWRHPSRGMVSRDLFVPLAEKTGDIRALTEWTLRRAIADQHALGAAGWPLPLSVNISARLLSDDAFTQAALTLARDAPHQLCFEITETAKVDNARQAFGNVARFAEHGVRISIDDYGSEFSSLTYLKRLPAHELKIDKRFVERIARSRRDALMVRATIELAHELGLEVVAEGVETPAAFELLASMGCDLAQGYMIARPAALEDLIGILAEAA